MEPVNAVLVHWLDMIFIYNLRQIEKQSWEVNIIINTVLFKIHHDSVLFFNYDNLPTVDFWYFPLKYLIIIYHGGLYGLWLEKNRLIY